MVQCVLTHPLHPPAEQRGMDASADYTDDWRDMFVIGSTDRTNAA